MSRALSLILLLLLLVDDDQSNILRLYISMKYSVPVAVLDAQDHLPKDVADVALRQAVVILVDVAVEVLLEVFEDDAVVILLIIEVQELHDIIMLPQLLEYAHLLHYLRFSILIHLQLFLPENLDSDRPARLPMLRHLHKRECALSYGLANFESGPDLRAGGEGHGRAGGEGLATLLLHPQFTQRTSQLLRWLKRQRRVHISRQRTRFLQRGGGLWLLGLESIRNLEQLRCRKH